MAASVKRIKVTINMQTALITEIMTPCPNIRGGAALNEGNWANNALRESAASPLEAFQSTLDEYRPTTLAPVFKRFIHLGEPLLSIFSTIAIKASSINHQSHRPSQRIEQSALWWTSRAISWLTHSKWRHIRAAAVFIFRKKKRVINLVKNKCALNGSDFRPLNGLPVRNVGRCSRKDVKILTGRYRRTHNELRRGAVKNVQSVHLFFFYIPPPLEATEASDN